MESIDYFKAIQGGIGVNSKREALIRETQRRLSYDLLDSVNLVPNATRNGVPQKFVVTPHTTSYKYHVMAMPGEELFTGDLLEFKGRHWMVVEMPSAPVMQYSAVVWECNHLFKFQNFNGDVIERWGVIDSGQYSTDVYNGTMLTDTNSQYRLYMQYDEETEQIFIDKRLAVAVLFDQSGKKILDVYKVTDVDPVTQSYGGGHLLMLRAVSDAYDPMKDSIDLMICDYINKETGDTTSELKCSISGSDEIRSGFLRTYTVSVIGDGDYDKDNISFEWAIDCSDPGVTLSTNGETATISVARNVVEGTEISLHVSCNNDGVSPSTKQVRVVGIL